MILILCIIIISTIIFLFSNQSGVKSNHTSDTVTERIIDLYESLSNKEVSSEARKEIIEKSRVLIRKLAHLSVYFVFGILIYLFIKTFNIKNKIVISIILSCLFASTDELHQYFIDGRTSSIVDVFIDTIGSTLGIFLTIIIKRSSWFSKLCHKNF